MDPCRDPLRDPGGTREPLLESEPTASNNLFLGLPRKQVDILNMSAVAKTSYGCHIPW